METVRAIYCRRHSIGSVLIRAATWSPWSHVATISSDGLQVVDARFPGGVRVRQLSELREISSKWCVREWRVPDARSGYAWLQQQIGKPYDYTWALGLGLQRDWGEDNAWGCSELHERFLEQCGLTRFVNQPQRVTPQHSWMVA
jgi:uncharacterized protein YycO